MIVLSNDDLIGLVSPPDLIAAVETAAVAVAQGTVLVPKRIHADWQGNTLLTMPAVAQSGFFGTKLVSVVPGNAARGLPVTNGLMILNDGDSGVPLAVMNAAALTAQRTGAVGSLGVKYMTPPNTASVGIVGCGVQGSWQAIFACSVRPIREVFCLDSSPDNVGKFTATVGRHVPQVRITPCRDALELLGRTNLVITATTSSEPVLPDKPAVLENKQFISIGSFKPSMQELPNAVYRLAGELAVDSEHALHEVGDVINIVTQGILDNRDIFPIAECITGKRTVDTARTTAYKTVGMAAYDLFVAQALYQAAKSRNIGRDIDL